MGIEVDEFFTPLKLKSPPSVSHYKAANLYIQVADAFARTAHQCVYIIDYYKQGFFYVSDNPLFLCGQSASSVQKLGYQFYMDHVPADELSMLLEINEAGFNFYDKISVFDRLNYTISYDFHLLQPNKRYNLINHKLTPLALDEDHNIWLALCLVSYSSAIKPGNITISKKSGEKRYEYDLTIKEWIIQKKIKLSSQEKSILSLSIQGFTMDEIGRDLKIVEATVKFHKKNIFKKLQVTNIAEAICCANNYNLFK